MLTNAPHLSGGGAQICFLCLLMHHIFVSAWRVSPCFLCSLMHHVCWIGPNLFSVLNSAPHLLNWPKSVSCALQCTTSVCLSIGSNLVCAHQCTASIWRGGPNLFSCSLMHLVYVSVWRVPLCFLCSLMHLVCWTGPNLFTCSPMHLVCVSVYRVQSGMCSLMHHFWLDEAQICFLCSLMHHFFCVCLEGLNLFCAH